MIDNLVKSIETALPNGFGWQAVMMRQGEYMATIIPPDMTYRALYATGATMEAVLMSFAHKLVNDYHMPVRDNVINFTGGKKR